MTDAKPCPFCGHALDGFCDSPGAIVTRTTGCPVHDAAPAANPAGPLPPNWSGKSWEEQARDREPARLVAAIVSDDKGPVMRIDFDEPSKDVAQLLRRHDDLAHQLRFIADNPESRDAWGDRCCEQAADWIEHAAALLAKEKP